MPRPVVDPLVRVRRQPERARYDEADVAEVLDAAFVCHVGVVRDGRPVVVPTLYARDGDRLILHGSPVAGMFRDLGRNPQVCVTVTVLDGLVLARSAFHHSVNYRSVVVHGEAREVTEPEDKLAALKALTDHVTPGQWAVVRRPDEDELRQTTAWVVPLTQASVKLRTGMPGDDPADLDLPVWGGVLPLTLTPGQLVADEHVPAHLTPPRHLTDWRRPGT
jgi:nitroimidazol reductase NimA-like FMN-containing flavoprotein (pyridoxamine 5'-phosphate oxidase superfamily)